MVVCDITLSNSIFLHIEELLPLIIQFNLTKQQLHNFIWHLVNHCLLMELCSQMDRDTWEDEEQAGADDKDCFKFLRHYQHLFSADALLCSDHEAEAEVLCG